MVGFADFGPARNLDETGELYAIYVQPEAWGGGFGRALMGEVLRGLEEAGFRQAILWVLEDNPRSRRFYERGGWALDSPPTEEIFLDRPVAVVRYRIALGPSG